jgi:hypothetical protein
VIRRVPGIHKYSLENKKIRLRTFFADKFSEEELDIIAIAVQGIVDSFYEQKGEGRFNGNTVKVSNLIVDCTLRLLGCSSQRIKQVIDEVEKYIKKKYYNSRIFYNMN